MLQLKGQSVLLQQSPKSLPKTVLHCNRQFSPKQQGGVLYKKSVFRINHRALASLQTAPVEGAEVVHWWEKDATPNMRDINSTQEFVDALAEADDRLVVVEFFAPWCAVCRALHPKVCKIMRDHMEITFLRVNFDKNKPMCKALNVKVLPLFHFYHGAEGRVESLSCSLSKVDRLREALERWNTPICSLEPTPELPEFPDIHASIDEHEMHPVYEHEGYDWSEKAGPDDITVLPPYATDSLDSERDAQKARS